MLFLYLECYHLIPPFIWLLLPLANTCNHLKVMTVNSKDPISRMLWQTINLNSSYDLDAMNSTEQMMERNYLQMETDRNESFASFLTCNQFQFLPNMKQIFPGVPII